MARGPKRNPRTLAAVERMLLDAEPPSRIRAEISRRYRISPRTVSSYIQICDATRAEEERLDARHRRPRARATASAALARCLIRAQRLADESDQLLEKAQEYEAEIHEAVEGGLLFATAPPDPSNDPEDVPPSEAALKAKARLAHDYRYAAMEALKRAEAAEQRADAWFTQLAKVSGIYEPEVVILDPSGSIASMTSAQRRTREAKVMAQLRKSIAAVKEKAEASRAGVAAGAT